MMGRFGVIAFVLAVVLLLAASCRADIFAGGSDEHENIQFQNCRGFESDVLTIHKVQVKPHITPGERVQIGWFFTLSQEVKQATARVDAFYRSFVPVFGGNYDLCEFTRCPIAAGDHVGHSRHETVPSVLFSGDYRGKVEVFDERRTKIACVEFSFTVR